MAKKTGKSQNLPCPICGYPAWSQADLEGHMKGVHGKAAANPVVAPTVSTPPASVFTATVSPAETPTPTPQSPADEVKLARLKGTCGS